MNCAVSFNSLSRDHSDEAHFLSEAMALSAFNSLSRDHEPVYESPARREFFVNWLSTPSLGITLSQYCRRGREREARAAGFQLPLSGSHQFCLIHVEIEQPPLSTPSLGITRRPRTEANERNRGLSTPSLGITHSSADLPSGFGSDFLSTPSLGITYKCNVCDV